jgi:hypothetical protein
MLFYGMSSESAMTRHVGGVAKYRAAEGKYRRSLRGPPAYRQASRNQRRRRRLSPHRPAWCNRKFMLFYGMSSESAMTRHVGGVAKYRAAEGKTVKLNHSTAALFVARQHTAKHHEISAAAEGFRHIARHAVLWLKRTVKNSCCFTV